jgi:putative phage-type endonuclease
MAVFLEKTGRLPDRDEEPEYMRWGRLLEDAITKEFEVRTSLFVRRRQSMLSHRERPWMKATIDGAVTDDPAGALLPLGVLEIKTVAGFKSDAWADDAIPDHFRIQVLHQLIVTGQQHAWVAVLFGGQRLEIREVDLDEDDAASLIALEEAFWKRVQDDEPPAGDGTEGSTSSLRAAYANGGGRPVALGDEALGLIVERLAATAEMNLAEKRKATAEQGLMALLGDAEVGLIDGRPRVTWKRFLRKDVDIKGLRIHHTAIVDRFTRQMPYRVLRVVGTADEGE